MLIDFVSRLSLSSLAMLPLGWRRLASEICKLDARVNDVSVCCAKLCLLGCLEVGVVLRAVLYV